MSCKSLFDAHGGGRPDEGGPAAPTRAAARSHRLGRRGQAAAAMAKAVEENWPGPLEGLVVTRYGHGLPCAPDRGGGGGHPSPTLPGAPPPAGSWSACAGLTADDLVLVLISGGGSALLTLGAGPRA